MAASHTVTEKGGEMAASHTVAEKRGEMAVSHTVAEKGGEMAVSHAVTEKRKRNGSQPYSDRERRNAIPKTLLTRARNFGKLPKESYLGDQSKFQLEENIEIDLEKAKAKDFCWLLNNKCN
ncbi:hypothetical protein ACROYT_G017513 [Oculina patagonica]